MVEQKAVCTRGILLQALHAIEAELAAHGRLFEARGIVFHLLEEHDRTCTHATHTELPGSPESLHRVGDGGGG